MSASASEQRPEADAARTVARSFVDAVIWGEHLRVWELFSPSAREHALAAGARRGLDAVAAERARQGTWSAEEADRFLTALVHGLRVDLSGVELDEIVVVEQPERLPDGSLRFNLETPTAFPEALTNGANWMAGAVVVGFDAAATPSWRVHRLIARPATRPST